MADSQTAAQQGILSPLLEGVRRPIPGDNPCGRDISYEEDFLAIKAEIDKMSTVSGQVDQERAAELRQMMDTARGTVRKADRLEAEKQLDQRSSVVKQSGGPDYQFIRQTAATLLSERSKDIRVASYLCFSLWKLNSFAGLAEGLSAVEIVFREFWEGFYPGKNRLAARKGALDFLAAKLDENVAYVQVREADRPALERAKATLKTLQEQFLEKMPDSPPSLLGLLQAVEKGLNKVPQPAASKPVPETRPLAGDTPHEQSTTAGTEIPKTTPAQTEPRSFADSVAVVRQAARFMREQNPKSAIPYRLMRSLQWDPIAQLPPNENGKTRFQAPSAPDRSALLNLRENKNWTKLLDECEGKLAQMGFHVWLDMQRFAVEALEGMGPEFAAARAGVVAELSLLLQRIPKMPSLTFSDGTRLADPATASWLDETVAGTQSSVGGHASGQGAVEGELETQMERAKQVFQAGDLAGSIALLSAPQTDTSRKATFRRKLAIANFCIRGGQPAIARPLLEELEQEIERFSVHEWEPRLALEAWTALNTCYQTLASGPATPAKQTLLQLGEKVFERICRLDITFALASAGIKPSTKKPAPAPVRGHTESPVNGGTNGSNDSKEITTHPQS